MFYCLYHAEELPEEGIERDRWMIKARPRGPFVKKENAEDAGRRRAARRGGSYVVYECSDLIRAWRIARKKIYPSN